MLKPFGCVFFTSLVFFSERERKAAVVNSFYLFYQLHHPPGPAGPHGPHGPHMYAQRMAVDPRFAYPAHISRHGDPSLNHLPHNFNMQVY